VLVDVPVALGAALAVAFIVGFRAPNSFEMGVYVLAGSWVGALGLGRIERSGAFLWSSLYVAAANLVTLVLFRFVAHETSLAAIAPYALAAVGNAGLAAFIAVGSLFFLGRVFGITTSLDLLELTRPTHPLLRKLLAEAPGTYHHSLIVSQLAEQAAHQIGADALLVRVAAYYHDVGKTREPQSFVENQLDGINLHDALDPQTSASIVIDHVQRGIALAQKYRLPARIREMIPQHHGTTLAAFFHHKAKEAGSAPVEDALFRYRGPKPQSREAGILMLADGVEATARAERPTTPEQIHVIVDRIVNERLRDGQLDESNLTLRDIQRIKDAFFGVLQGMFHTRVRYPISSEHDSPRSGAERGSSVISLQRRRGNRDSRS
jgi:putative nucleotidyltransferase with HDIG domain